MPEIIQHPLGRFEAWHDNIGAALARGDFWDAHLRPIFDAVDPACWAIDVGANVGFHTTYLARRYAQVIAVEPHPATVGLLSENLRLNQVIDRVTVIQAAAYDRLTELAISTEVEFPIPDEWHLDTCTSASSICFVPLDQAHGRLVIKTVVLDDVVPPGSPIGLIKVDAQGCDLRVLRGLEQTIRRCRPIVVFEIEPKYMSWHGDPPEGCHTFLAGLDYTVEQPDLNFSDFVAHPRTT